MQYNNAILNDLPLIVEIYNTTISSRMVTADTKPVTVADKLNWFNAHNAATRPLWIVKENNMEIGWVSYNNFYGRPAYDGTAELSIYLHPDARGKGWGKKILNHCIEQAPVLKIHTLLAIIFSHNEVSIRLFLQAGFTQWGLLKDIAVMDEKKYSVTILGKKTE